MAHKRKPVPPDPPFIVEVREQLKPDDTSTVIASPEVLKEWYFCWVHPRMLPTVKSKGYSVVKPGEFETPFAYGDKTTKGQIWNLDTVLVKCPRAAHDERVRKRAMYNRQAIEGQAAAVQEQAARSRVDLKQSLTVDETLKGEEASSFITAPIGGPI
jgi:hypothetical protein